MSSKELEGCVLDVEAKRACLSDDDDTGAPSGEEEEEGWCGAALREQPLASFSGRISSGHHDDPSRPPPLGEAERPEEEWVEAKDEFGRDILVPLSAAAPQTPLDPQRTLAFTQTESAAHLQHIGSVSLSLFPILYHPNPNPPFFLFLFLYVFRAHYGPQTEFPLLEPTEARKRKTRADEEPVEKYFDAGLERRQMGTGFYTLSRDPVERLRQQAELRAREHDTLRARSAATDLPQLTPAQIALEARKRLVLAKKNLRRTSKPNNPDPPALPAPSSSS